VNDQVAQNKRRSLVLTTVFVLLVGTVVAVVLSLFGLGLVGVLIAAVVAAGSAFASWWRSDVVALRLSGAVEADPVTYARLHNLVEGLCIASGLPKPQIYVIDDVAPNAFATGRSPKHATVAVTTGLLDLLDRVELEGVLAHELSHIKNHDILVATLAVTMVGLVTPQLVPFAVDRRREPLADVSAVEMTRYPPGLISALEKLGRDSTAVAASSRAIAHLWIEAPSDRPDGGEGEGTATASTHPPIEERIAALREL
jgi:heat shock protein HtpX